MMIWRVTLKVSYHELSFDFDKATTACEFAKNMVGRFVPDEDEKEITVAIQPIAAVEEKESED